MRGFRQRKQWKGDEECKLCKDDESADHLMFVCPFSKFLWFIIKDGLGWTGTPKNLKVFLFSYFLF
jgi:hypothetical protein